MNKPTQEDAINLATTLENVMAPQFHVGLTGSQLYGGRSGHIASFKDIDIIVYPGTTCYLDLMDILLKLQKAGLTFVRYAEHREYNAPSSLMLPRAALPVQNKMVWVMDYNGTRVDVQLRQ